MAFEGCEMGGYKGSWKRFAGILVLALGLLAGIPSIPGSTGTDSLPTISYLVAGLERPAEILLDPWGIPHIYAGSLYEAFFVQGFNAARDRLWQIDLWRRRGLGKLAEVFGLSYVEKDRAARLFLYRGDMYQEWLAYGSDAKRIAIAFVQGINEYVKLVQRTPELLPLEFRLLRYEPALWAPEDVIRIRSHGLVRNVRSEVVRAQVVCKFGPKVDAIRAHLEPAWQLKVPEGLDPCQVPEDVLRVYTLATGDVRFSKDVLKGTAPVGDRVAAEQLEEVDVGSNNWAIAPKFTATGRPILANDPHRAQSVPSLRYAAHLVAPGLNVIGAGEPALPGISIGHNERIAFGLTIFSIDQEDLYMYETNPENTSEYRYKDRWEPMQVVTESIPVRGRDPVRVELKLTRHGPVIYEDPARHIAFAVRAAWLEPGMAPYFGSVEYMRAQNWNQFLAAMNRWGAPSENQVYADVDGNIGWKPGGLTPIRPNWDGLLPVPGDGRYEWGGFRSMDQLPVEVNPARGWVATANQMNLPPNYPHQLGFEWAPPWRYQRIAEVLSKASGVTLLDALRLQTDYLSIPGRRVVALLKGLHTNDAQVAKAVTMLSAWNAMEAPESAAAALFEVWYTRYLGKAVVAKLVPQGARAAVGNGDSRVILEILEHPDAQLGPDPVAARNTALLSSLREAVDELEVKFGPQMERWAWGQLHHAAFEHPLSSVVDEPTRALFDVGPMPRGGSGDTVGNTGYRASDFRQIGGSSWRMVLDVGDWDNSLAMNTPGQSGNPFSPYYRDLFPRWATDQAFRLLYSRKLIEAVAEWRIVLQPASR